MPDLCPSLQKNKIKLNSTTGLKDLEVFFFFLVLKIIQLTGAINDLRTKKGEDTSTLRGGGVRTPREWSMPHPQALQAKISMHYTTHGA